MLECNPKGCWLCKGSATACQCIPFLGLKKHFLWRSKVARQILKLNLEICHVYCMYSLQTGVICMQSASWLTNICQPEVFNTSAQPGLTRHGRILSECESNLYIFKESLHIMSQGKGSTQGRMFLIKKKKNFPCKWKIC